MELMGKDLNEILKHDLEFSDEDMIKILYNSLCAIAFLHESNVVHRDMKPANILINSDCEAKISDFGLSRTIPQCCQGLENFNSICMREELFDNLQNNKIGRQREN